ncbi:helix-turn-helix domain-containing protein [Acinetobacter brisouii]|uniref:helix-turn-helix domain-containing protein n=1 Tax=Acinetobacter brisouii TaxID=396323 RepID=UPI0012501752|nr:helix-turn-helix domain-containing protein [Acinetobacter brisouii]
MNAHIQTPAPVLTHAQIAILLEKKDGAAYQAVIEQVEKPLIEAALVQHRGNQTAVALQLGINRGTLRKKLKLHGLLKAK